ncbi:putative uncharacterized protein DDB_G0282133 [Spodoptera frugiperda]|uniref:Uncharacterized protein n=1 Tax=Spodoptera frugiperda TaxID=7108 RepID=A0A9R0E6P7_SPOFR|nr:putative uncharacterized protein DDB_G0282133 [Spodoptera frugiperda]
MSHSNVINEKKKALLAYKEKIQDEIKYYEKTIDEFRVNHKNNSFYDDSDSSDSEDEFPFAVDTGPSVSELKLKQALLKTCLHATQELTSLTVLQSEVELLVEEPKIEGEPPITEPGVWKEVTAECNIDLVPFTITFYMHTPSYKFAPTSYRGLRVVPVKGSHELELSKSVLHSLKLPSDAVEVLRSYADGYRSRRTTLARLANKYASSLFMEPHPEGGFILKCAGLLEVSWRLENKWSPVAPFHHKMKFDLEYMDESYIKTITQAHKQLLDPSIQTDERTLLLAKIIATCLEARGPVVDSDLESKTTERDSEMEKRDSEVMAPPKSLPKKGKQKIKDGNPVKRDLGEENVDNLAKRVKTDSQGDVAKKASIDNAKTAKVSDVVTEGSKKRKIVDVNKVGSAKIGADDDQTIDNDGKKRKVIDDKATSAKNTKESVVNKEINAKTKNVKDTDGVNAKNNNVDTKITNTNAKTNKNAKDTVVNEGAVTKTKNVKDSSDNKTKNKNVKDAENIEDGIKTKTVKEIDGSKAKNTNDKTKNTKTKDNEHNKLDNAKKSAVNEKNDKETDSNKAKSTNLHAKNKNAKDFHNKEDGNAKNIAIEAKEANTKSKTKAVKEITASIDTNANTKPKTKEISTTDPKTAKTKVKNLNVKDTDTNNLKKDNITKNTEVELKKNFKTKNVDAKNDEKQELNKITDHFDKKKPKNTTDVKNKENVNANRKTVTNNEALNTKNVEQNTKNDTKTTKTAEKPTKNDLKHKNNDIQEKKMKNANPIKSNVQKTATTVENNNRPITKTIEKQQKPEKLISKTKSNNILTATAKNATNFNTKDRISNIKDITTEKTAKKSISGTNNTIKSNRHSLASNKITKPLASHRKSLKNPLPAGNTNILKASNIESGKISKIPQKKFSPVSEGSSKNNMLRISPRINPLKLKMLPQDTKQKMIKTTSIPRLLKKPAPKV